GWQRIRPIRHQCFKWRDGTGGFGMTHVIDLPQHINETIHGCYRVLKVERRVWHRPDKPSIILTIADATGVGWCLGSIETGEIGLNGATIVCITGQVRQSKKGRLFVRTAECTPVLRVSNGSWHLLPR